MADQISDRPAKINGGLAPDLQAYCVARLPGPLNRGIPVSIKSHLRQAGHIVVCEGSHVILQHLDVLRNDVRSGAVLFIAPQLVVRLDDVRQFVRQIVLQANPIIHSTFYFLHEETSTKKASVKARISD